MSSAAIFVWRFKDIFSALYEKSGLHNHLQKHTLSLLKFVGLNQKHVGLARPASQFVSLEKLDFKRPLQYSLYTHGRN